MIKGIGASNGIAIGKAFIINDVTPKISRKNFESIEDRNAELQRFKKAVSEAEKQLHIVVEAAEKNLGKDEVEIIKSQMLFLQDPEFVGTVEGKVISDGINSEYALQAVMDMYVSIFEAMEDEYMRERAGDVRDIGGRIMNLLLGVTKISVADINEQCIIVAKDLTPSDTAQIVKERVMAFVTALGGRTSHSSIMARTLDIPAVVGISNSVEEIKPGDMLIVHGDSGEVIVNPSEEVLMKYRELQKEIVYYKSRLMDLKDLEARTLDGRTVELAGNIGNPDNAKEVTTNGGDGVGLFRTEFLYMNNHRLPSEEEQFKAYKEALEHMGDKPVIIRTLDIGGDKKLPYLPIEEEQNPFLGYRAIRLCLKERGLFKTQLRALLRASVYGSLKIMFPMVSSVEEIRETKKLMEEAKLELNQEGLTFKHNIPVGIMIEIPSAAIISDLLAKEVDFFSIGTNDLIQYTIAVDRMNEKVSYLYNPLHPGVLRLIKLIIDNAHSAGKWVGMCGEMAGDLRAVPLLIGMGLDEFSVSAPSILKVKDLIRNLNYEHCRKAVEEVFNLATAEEIEHYLKEKEIWV